CFEGKWSRGRGPLNSLPCDTPFHFSMEDLKLLDAIEELAGGDTPAMLMLTSENFAPLLSKIVGHPRITLGKSQPLTVRAEPWRPPLQAHLEPSGEILLSLQSTSWAILIPGEPSWVFHERTFEPVGLPASCRGILQGPVRLSRKDVPIFLS